MARARRHDGLDDLPNPSGAAIQGARTSLRSVLQFYLNNPNQMPLHLETQFRQRNLEITIEWLLSAFTSEQTQPSTSQQTQPSTSKNDAPAWLIPVAIIATVTGTVLYQRKHPSCLRARPTWEDKNQIGFRVYLDPNKKAESYESWTDDIYQRQRERNSLIVS